MCDEMRFDDEGLDSTPKPMTAPADDADADLGLREKIVAAAIQAGPVVFTGPHHASIIHYVAACTGIKRVTGTQGFVTSRGRFVSRKEANIIAVAAGQIPAEQAADSLFSEMLWLVQERQAVDRAASGGQYKHVPTDEEIKRWGPTGIPAPPPTAQEQADHTILSDGTCEHHHIPGSCSSCVRGLLQEMAEDKRELEAEIDDWSDQVLRGRAALEEREREIERLKAKVAELEFHIKAALACLGDSCDMRTHLEAALSEPAAPQAR